MNAHIKELVGLGETEAVEELVGIFGADIAELLRALEFIVQTGAILDKIGLESLGVMNRQHARAEPTGAPAKQDLEEGVAIQALVDKGVEVVVAPVLGAKGCGLGDGLVQSDVLGPRKAHGDGIVSKIVAKRRTQGGVQQDVARLFKAGMGPDIGSDVGAQSLLQGLPGLLF